MQPCTGPAARGKRPTALRPKVALFADSCHTIYKLDVSDFQVRHVFRAARKISPRGVRPSVTASAALSACGSDPHAGFPGVGLRRAADAPSRRFRRALERGLEGPRRARRPEWERRPGSLLP